MASFRGPCRYYKVRNSFEPRKDSMIEEASMTIEDQGTFNLEQNKISFWIPPDSQGIVSVYHSYDHRFEDGIAHGRWYDTEYPLQNVHALPASNEFVYTLDNYELNDAGSETGTATFRITFKAAAAAKLRVLGQG